MLDSLTTSRNIAKYVAYDKNLANSISWKGYMKISTSSDNIERNIERKKKKNINSTDKRN